MRRLTYVLRFHRPPAPPPAELPTTAPGLRIETRLEAGRVDSSLEPLDGDRALLDLQFATNQDLSLFFEWGTLTFGADGASSLTFSSIGAGTLGPPDSDGFSHGTVAYAVTGGTGELAGAGGFIDSNFLIDLTTNELIDTHLGIIRLP